MLVKLPAIIADLGLTVLVCHAAWRTTCTDGELPAGPATAGDQARVGWHRGAARSALVAGLAYALHPLAVLITGYHGQFDALMLAPTFLAWYVWSFWQGRLRLVLSALAPGVGVWFKPVPLVLLPIFPEMDSGSGCGVGFQLHVVAELGQATNVVARKLGRVELIEMGGAQLVVGRAALEHVVDDGQQAVCNGDGGSFLATPSGDAAERIAAQPHRRLSVSH
jgi:hypothetical protein